MKYCAIFIFLLLAAPVLAWDADTHKQACVDAANLLEWDFNETLLREACVAPDKHFDNTIMHHCYWWDCPAMAEAYAWREKGDLYSLGVAAHYRADAECVMHELVLEPRACHHTYEHEIGELVKKDRFNFTYEIECGWPSKKFAYTSSDYHQLVQNIAAFWNHTDANPPSKNPVSFISRAILKIQRLFG